MNFHQLIDEYVIPDIMHSVSLFGPELILCVTIFVILLARVLPVSDKVDSFYLAVIGVLVALAIPWGGQPWEVFRPGADIQQEEIFTGMLVYDGFTLFIRGLLLFFTVLLILLVRLTGIFDHRDGPDIYTLILGATLGMCLMASANHLLMVFLSVEMASVPSYVLAGLRKTRRQSSEAALKYSVFGAGAAGVMLYGISLVAGAVNSVHLPTIAARLPQTGADQYMVLAVGGLMIMVGLAFKLSAVPFHFWCPDVFEGASAEVNAFLSVASKAAALALLVRVALGMGAGVLPHSDPLLAVASRPVDGEFNVADTDHAIQVSVHKANGHESVDNDDESDDSHATVSAAGTASADIQFFIAMLIAFVAAITCTFGNLAAYGQTNINRLLAYSTIAHAGYMMMPVPAAVVMCTVAPESAEVAISSLAIYLGIYLFMNLGAFAIVAFLRGVIGSEEIADYAGLVRRLPLIVVCFAVILFSLIGIPPLAGFIGKFAVFAALVDGYRYTGSTFLMVLLVIGGLNTAISLFYYLRVIKVMTIDPEPETCKPIEFSMVSLAGGFIVLVTAPLVLLILGWNWFSEGARAAVQHLLS